MSNRAAPYAHLFGIARKTGKPARAKPASAPAKASAKPIAKPKAPTKPTAAGPDFSHLRRAAPAPAPLTPAERAYARGERARAALPTPGTIDRPGPRQTAPAVANPERLAAEIIAAGKRRRGEA